MTSRLSGPFRNAGKLLLGQAGQAVMNLIAMVLAARILGAADLGRLVLVHSLVLGLSQIFQVHNWRFLAVYGGKAQYGGDRGRFCQFLGAGMILDSGGALAALGAVWVLAGPASQIFGLQAETLFYYGLAVVPMTLAPSAHGILRHFERFDLLAWQSLAMPLIRMTGAVTLWFSGGALFGFLVLWFIASVASRFVLFAMAVAEGVRRDVHPALPRSIRSETGTGSFLGGHYLRNTLKNAQPHLVLWAAGAALGAEAAGLYHIAQKIAEVLVKPASKLLVPAFYPELVRLEAGQEVQLRRALLQRALFWTSLIAAVLVGILVLFGDRLLILTGGPAFTQAHAVLMILAVAGAIELVAFPLEPLLSASGKMRSLIGAELAGFAGLVAGLVFLIPAAGLEGLALAYAFGIGLSVLVMLMRAGRAPVTPHR